MKTRVLMITYNRPVYTELALSRLCETLPQEAEVVVWDNGSSDEMVRLLKKFETHRGVARVVFNKTNDRLWGPTNWFWENYGDAEFLSKVDDDGLMPEKWIETLWEAHKDIPETGILGTWRFPDEDFDAALAAPKIFRHGRHQLFCNCWVEGSGYLMKREVLRRIGPLTSPGSFTTYCIRAAAAGFINGWYFPFLYQEHMDDPRAPHTGIKTEADFQKLAPLSAKTFKNASVEDWTRQLRYLAWSLHVCSYNPKDYLGWRAKLRQKWARLRGQRYLPRV